jgi:hypothetical protein
VPEEEEGKRRGGEGLPVRPVPTWESLRLRVGLGGSESDDGDRDNVKAR